MPIVLRKVCRPESSLLTSESSFIANNPDGSNEPPTHTKKIALPGNKPNLEPMIVPIKIPQGIPIAREIRDNLRLRGNVLIPSWVNVSTGADRYIRYTPRVATIVTVPAITAMKLTSMVDIIVATNDTTMISVTETKIAAYASVHFFRLSTFLSYSFS